MKRRGEIESLISIENMKPVTGVRYDAAPAFSFHSLSQIDLCALGSNLSLQA